MTIPLVPDLPAGLEHDPEVFQAMKRLALAAIESATDLLETSAPAIQMQMIRLLLPQVSRSLSTAKGDDDGELKAAVSEMYDAVRASIGAS
jgi:hypothetical protein